MNDAWNRRAFALLLTIAAVASLTPSDRRTSVPFLRSQRCLTRYGSNVSIESAFDDGEVMDDDTLLNAVSKEQLARLCDQCRISKKGTKEEMLQRLRHHATKETEAAAQRIVARIRKVEEGSSETKERYEILNDEPDDDAVEDESYFFFELPCVDAAEDTPSSGKSQGREPPRKATSRDAVTAPLPPASPNADGERVVTVYSTAEQNDLTAISAAQPGRGALDVVINTGASSATQHPWDMQRISETSSRQVEQAKDKIIDLVSALLATTGAPGFTSFDRERNDGDDESPYLVPQIKKQIGLKLVGFNPANVPADLLTSSSQALRVGRGQVLQDVLRRFELEAVGQDGMAGDNKEKGGGHYREVSKVRAFLEGFRRAEVRRLARETAALLLDKIVLDGVEGLDSTLNTMVRSSDDTADYAGELNDSLLDFLNDVIRQQQKKVDEIIGSRRFAENAVLKTKLLEEDYDPFDSLWNVTVQDGQRVETFNPNDPGLKSMLQAEVYKASLASHESESLEPISAPEKLLLLLTLLRERIKAEAAFAPDEKGRNLRLLSYCLRVSTDDERKLLILKFLGNSLDVSMYVYL